ncbi:MULTISPECIES: BlaI/MecI/CopY family transcriptional regulator [Pseudonocardia]|uniref:Transcriptional regulator BlaI n=2 Tax=Pseudonocardia TaxID=1847 RepID=A0A1Y2MPM1_PSEAH|nr:MULTISPECIES: BlaI/MecI/CopY family transcriptional regulator [Pseudonocardia]OSY37180.1 Transcriptional regulator BlaI [Pseudonocardia autotrophica]TDN74801.1 putative transcriptional regulator [Pseudonocardia autotrophica]BBG05576.1 penicillinase repressor [Pseudonocardia autotrophica]GEC25827.1 penicillinase repressor [Pseudonocardia saturnea]
MRGRLGELEAAVMDVLWDGAAPCRVRDVRARLAPGRPLAYTTVMTVLDNLHRKGWVQRELDGRAYLYRPAATREEETAQALRELLDAAGDTEAVLLHFARSVSERESAVLRAALTPSAPPALWDRDTVG